MENYLYILPFKDKNHFKIGISSKNYTRIKHLDKLYSVNLDKSLIITAGKNSTIKILETELLTIFPKADIYKNTEGRTEIRDIKYLNECIDYIKQKHKNLKIKIHKYYKKIAEIKISGKVPEVQAISTFNSEKVLKQCGIFYNALEQIAPHIKHVKRTSVKPFSSHIFYLNLPNLKDAWDLCKLFKIYVGSEKISWASSGIGSYGGFPHNGGFVKINIDHTYSKHFYKIKALIMVECAVIRAINKVDSVHMGFRCNQIKENETNKETI